MSELQGLYSAMAVQSVFGIGPTLSTYGTSRNGFIDVEEEENPKLRLKSFGKEGSDMSKQVIASLEGMRIVVDDGWCELHEYDFSQDHWVPKDRHKWPLALDEAKEWVKGWNALDRFAAVNRLVAPVPE